MIQLNFKYLIFKGILKYFVGGPEYEKKLVDIINYCVVNGKYEFFGFWTGEKNQPKECTFV